MNFSDSKQNNLTKKCQARAFKVNTSTTDILFDQISKNSNFSIGKVIIINNEKHIKLKEFNTSNDCHYLHFSIFNPKEQVSTTPNISSAKDLIDVENMDSLHAFFIVKKNTIASLMQISTNWCESKISTIFEKFGIKLTPTVILKKDTIARIKRDGFRAFHINMQVDESDFVNPPGFLSSIMQKAPALKQQGITGHFTIDARSNIALANSVENNTATWINDLDSDFYIETKEGEKIMGDDLKLVQTYYTVPYGSKSINARYAKEILEHFVLNQL